MDQNQREDKRVTVQMKTTIWKYPVQMGQIEDDFQLRMPTGAKVLTVAYDPMSLSPSIWAFIPNVEAPEQMRSFAVRGTGHDASGLRMEEFIGTVVYPNIPLVFHFWERAVI